MGENKKLRLLIINPGSTSTKISLYENETSLYEESIFHDAPLLLQFPNVNDQLPFRYQTILDMLARHGESPESIDVFVGRGGSAQTQPSGVTLIDEKLVQDTRDGVGGSEHPARLGVLLAWQFSCEYHKPAYTLNPTNVDELCDLARLTGIKGVYRLAQAHVLNQKAIAQAHAAKLGRRYEDCDFIVCHIDGGITVNAHAHGRMVDGNVGAGGDGSYTPTRIGSVPVLSLLDYIESHSVDEARLLCSRAGGFVSFFGTADSDAIHARVESGDEEAAIVWNGMIYNIGKQVGAMAAALNGHVDGILLTGGLVRFSDIVEGIRRMCGWIAPVDVYPGELEQDALALSVLDALHGRAPILRYTGEPVWHGFSWDK